MTFEVQRPLVDLEIGDYTKGKGDVIWKVVAKREDGHVGIQNAEGARQIVKPEHARGNVTQVVYGYDSLEDMHAATVKTVETVLGGKVIDDVWTMPSLDELYRDDLALRGHLKVHHGVDTDGATMHDLREAHKHVHDPAHHEADHTHP